MLYLIVSAPTRTSMYGTLHDCILDERWVDRGSFIKLYNIVDLSCSSLLYSRSDLVSSILNLVFVLVEMVTLTQLKRNI